MRSRLHFRLAIRWLAVCSLAYAALLNSAVAQALQLEETESAITIRQGDRLILAYNKQSPPLPDGMNPAYRRSGFLHPVLTPGGLAVTETFPIDHPHQHGIFTAWVKTSHGDREVDFWNLAGGTGRVLHERVVSTFSDAEAAGMEVDLLHRSLGEPPVDVLRERWRIRVYPTDGTHHCFDLETTQAAITDRPLVVHEYHYGGVALRGPTRWLTEKDRDAARSELVREPSAFVNDSGSDRVQGNHEHAKWVALTGAINGRTASIAVLCHAENFRAPQAARLHPTKPYFCFAPCVDGEFEVSRDRPFQSRYRFLVTDAPPDAAWLDARWNGWCGR